MIEDKLFRNQWVLIEGVEVKLLEHNNHYEGMFVGDIYVRLSCSLDEREYFKLANRILINY